MNLTPQNKKRSSLKSRLGKYAAKLGNAPEKFNKAMSRIIGTERSAIQSVITDKSAHPEENSINSKDSEKNHSAFAPEEHVKQEKQEKAIGHIQKLFEQINDLQDEIGNSLQTEKPLEEDGIAVNEQSSRHTPQKNQVKKHQKQEPDELTATHGSSDIKRERPQKKTEKNDSHHVNKEVNKKLCPQCKKKRTRSDFHKDKSSKDGLARWCKECKAKASRISRKKPKDIEQESNRNPKEKSQPSCSMEKGLSKTKTNALVKTEKILNELHGLGMKYGRGSRPEYSIESHYQFTCQMADRTTKDITVVVREKDVSVFHRPNPPEWFEGKKQVDEALKQVETLLQKPMKRRGKK